jgi:ABC-type uncharacterized transport system permease subunit
MFEQQLINALSLGSVYALFALGFTLVFGVLGVINLAHGAIFMLGSYVALLLVSQFQMSLWLAMLIAMLTCGVIGVIVDFLIAAFAQTECAASGTDDRHHRRRHHDYECGTGFLWRRKQTLSVWHDTGRKFYRR